MFWERVWRRNLPINHKLKEFIWHYNVVGCMIGPEKNPNFPPIFGYNKSVYTILCPILFLSTHNEPTFLDISHLPTGLIMHGVPSNNTSSSFSIFYFHITWNYYPSTSSLFYSACAPTHHPSQRAFGWRGSLCASA